MLLVAMNSRRAGTEWSRWESMDCCNVCHAAWEDWEEEREKSCLQQTVDTYIHNNSEHSFFPIPVCLPLCLFPGSLVVVGQDRPAATG